MTLTCYVLDDDDHAVNAVVKHIEKIPELICVGNNIDPIAALKEIKLAQPNIVFLDVEMPELSGIEVADLLPEGTLIVFITSHSKYAIEAIEKAAVGYLLKPFSFHMFALCVQKIKAKINLSTGKNIQINFHQLLIKVAATNKIVQIENDDIIYVEALNHYICIHTVKEKIISHIDMVDLETKLQHSNFARIHRKYIINTNAIKSIQDGHILLSNDHELPFGESYKKSFWDKVSMKIVKKIRAEQDAV